MSSTCVEPKASATHKRQDLVYGPAKEFAADAATKRGAGNNLCNNRMCRPNALCPSNITKNTSVRITAAVSFARLLALLLSQSLLLVIESDWQSGFA